MKLRQIGFKILSLVMVFAILFSVSATTISAAAAGVDNHAEEEKKELNYVSLGDSMTNGYGLPGYGDAGRNDGSTNSGSGVEDYGYGSYTNIFAEAIGATHHSQLAMSALRAEDLHWLLELDYNDLDAVALTEMVTWDEDAWNAVFTTGDYWTWKEICTHSRTRHTTEAILNSGYTEYPECYNPANKYVNDVALIAKYFQDSVADADVMSLGIGNGNFGVFSFGRIMEAIGFTGDPEDALIYRVENAIRELSPEQQAKVLELRAKLYLAIEDKLGMSLEENETLSVLANTVVYTGISFVLNYAGSVEAMLQLNPDAEIILVALMNTFAKEGDVEGISIGNLLDAVYEPLNVFIAALPTYMQLTENSVYANAKFYYASADYVECLVDVYGDELKNPDSVIRDRFVESIVGTAGDPGMVWGMLGNTDYVTLAEVEAYDSLETSAERIAFAMSNANKMQSILMYLAFEDAIVDASRGAGVGIDAVLGLGNMDASAFGSIFTDVSENTQAAILGSILNGDGYFSDVIAVVAQSLQASGYEAVVLANYADLQAMFVDYIANGRDAVIGKLANTIALANTGYDYATLVNYENAGYVPAGTAKAIIDGATTLVDSLYNGYVSAYTVLCTREIIAEAVSSNEAIYGLLSLFARCVIGNGLGAHP